MGLVRPDLGEHYRKRYRLEIDKPESSCALNTAVFSFLDIHHKKFQGGRCNKGGGHLAAREVLVGNLEHCACPHKTISKELAVEGLLHRYFLLSVSKPCVHEPKNRNRNTLASSAILRTQVVIWPVTV